MATYPQYLTYNPCTVIINGSYVITNIQEKGLPSDKCEAHLESISIKSSNVGSANPNDWGASGTITLIDYKNAVFNALRERIVDYLSSGNNNSHLSTVSIHIDCFTGSRDWFGWVTSWKYEFVGTTPSLNLDWTAIPPNGAVDTDKIPKNGEYTAPKDLVNDIQKAHPAVCGDVPIVDSSGQDVSSKLEFTSEKVNYDLSSTPQSSSPLVSGYNFVTQACTLDGKALAPGTIETDDNGKSKYVVKFANPEDNTDSTEEGKVIDGIIFVQNGSYPYYKAREDGKCVIPMTSFNFNTDMSKMVLQSRVLNNINGNIVQNASNGENYTQMSGTDAVNPQTASTQTGASGVVVSFECYNVLSFSMNNINEQVYYEIYDEFGNQHIASGSGTVTEVSYSLQGGVVKASVTAAEYYNKPEIASTGADSSEGNYAGGSGKSIADTGIISSEQEQSLKREDSMVVPLGCDRTRQLYQSGDFTYYVTEFFDRGYGELGGSERLLDWDYVQNLISTGNIGLFTLLLAVANYGIRGCPYTDAAREYSEYSGKASFFASDIGKKPLDYTTGGLGLPHWDADNLGTIYKKIGFMEETIVDPNFKDLLTDLSKKQDYQGKVTGFKEGQFCGELRWFPETTGKCYWRRFDEGLKSNSSWCNWANHLLNYNGPSGRIYQIYLFNLWLEKFWFPTINKLSTRTSAEHDICLQDAVRVAREGNSASGLIDKSAGKNVAGQFNDYLAHYSEKDKAGHAVRQWFFCRRATSLLEQCSSILPPSK